MVDTTLPTTAEGTCALSTEESVMEPFVISVDTTVPQGSVTIYLAEYYCEHGTHNVQNTHTYIDPKKEMTYGNE